DDVAARIALAPELRAEIVGGVLADCEEDALGVQLHSALELETVDATVLLSHASHLRGYHWDVERVESTTILRLVVDPRWLTVRADDDVARPRHEIQRHPDSLASCADHDGSLAPRLVAVAVGADVRGLTVDSLEPRNGRPHVLEPDREQEPRR